MKPAGDPPIILPSRYQYANNKLSGGQGAVYICRDTNLDRDVAIKVLHTISNIASLKKEIDARGKIRSKHVVEIYDVLVDSKGLPYALVLEFVPGETLADEATIPADLMKKLLLLYQLACGLRDIHEAGVIHRDIKPLNIKVDGGQVLKIFDLGLANLDADFASTMGGAGTRVFGGPELYLPAPIQLSRALDIYAFGVVAWHVLASKFPPPLLETPPHYSGLAMPSIATEVPGTQYVAEVFDRCLSVDPSMRPDSIEIVKKLHQLLTRGRRRGVFTWGTQTHELSKPGNSTNLKVGSLGELKILYDGIDFTVKAVVGHVAINNLTATVGQVIPDSCVLTFGSGTSREFIPFNVSQPQIVI